jgi:hypothetical protein
MKFYNKLIILLLLICLFFLFQNQYSTYEPYQNIDSNSRTNLYCFWTGNNEMSENRKKHLTSLNKTGLNVILITKDDLDQYIQEPLHEGFQYLSETHKADYLRTYFMHFYGGGYSDIKHTSESWLNANEELNNDPDLWIVGYKEIEGGSPVSHLLDKYEDLIGNGAYICKANTPLTQKWYTTMISVMDSKLEMLKQYPSKSPQQVHSYDYPYPLRWAELLGEIFHQVIYEYKDHLLNTLPAPSFTIAYR